MNMNEQELDTFHRMKLMMKSAERNEHYKKFCEDFKKLFDDNPEQATLVTKIIDVICIGNTLRVNDLEWYVDNSFLPFEGQNSLIEKPNAKDGSTVDMGLTEFTTKFFFDNRGNFFFSANTADSNTPIQLPPELYISVDHPQLVLLKQILMFSPKTAALHNRHIPIWTEKEKFWDSKTCKKLTELIISLKSCFISSDFKTYNKAAVIYYYQAVNSQIANLFTALNYENKEVNVSISSSDNSLNEMAVYNSMASNGQLFYSAGDFNCCEIFLPYGTNKAKINADNIYRFLEYFTCGDKKLFDSLSLDFCCLIMNPSFKGSNTVVTGYIEKFDKWIEQLSQFRMIIYPNPNFSPFVYTIYDIRIHDVDFCQAAMDGLSSCINDKGEIYQIIRLHNYLKLPRNASDNGFKIRGNNIVLDFKEGGDFYSLPRLSPEEMTWIYKMLFANGFNILNKSPSSKKSKPQNLHVEQDFTAKYLIAEEKSGMRVPLALLYMLYGAYSRSVRVGATISDIEFRKTLEENGFIYETQKLRKSTEIPYLQETVKPLMEQRGLSFDDKWLDPSKANKIIFCKINDSLWEQLELSDQPTNDNQNNTQENEPFRKYIEKLEAMYMTYFDYTAENLEKMPEKSPFISLNSFLNKL